MTWGWEELMLHYPSESMQTEHGPVSGRFAGAGTDIVLLHGIGSGSGSWVYQLAALADGYSVAAWDAPGYGDSTDLDADWPDADDYAAVLEALLDAREIDRCILVGHSLGALIAARFAATHPERVSALILADPAAGHGPRSDAEREERLSARLERFDRLGAERHAEERAPALLSNNATAEQTALVRWNMARLRRSGYEKAARLLATGDIFADLARVQSPTSVLCGSEDGITSPESCRRIAEAGPHPCPYREIHGAGHVSYVEAAEAFSAAVIKIARSVS